MALSRSVGIPKFRLTLFVDCVIFRKLNVRLYI